MTDSNGKPKDSRKAASVDPGSVDLPGDPDLEPVAVDADEPAGAEFAGGEASSAEPTDPAGDDPAADGEIDFMTFDPETAELTDEQALSLASDVDADLAGAGGGSMGVLADDTVETGLVSDIHPLPAGSAAWLVSHRELTTIGRSAAFLISSGFLLIAVLATLGVGLLAPADDASQDKVLKVATFGVDSSQVTQVEQQLNLKITTAKTEAALDTLVRDGKVDAGIVLKADPTGQTQPAPQVVALNSAPTELLDRLSPKSPVTLLQDPGHSAKFLTTAVLGFGLVFLLAALFLGGVIAASAQTERRTRVGEILVAAVPARAVTTGKILGAGVLALAQAVAVGAILLLGLSIASKQELLLGLLPTLGWFILLFAAGFVLFAALWLAFGSLASRAARNTWFVILGAVAVGGAFLPAVFAMRPSVLKILSYIPFSAPAAMPLRVLNKTATDWWEPLAVFAGLVVLAVIAVLVANRVYATSVLKEPKRVSFKKGRAARELAVALQADKTSAAEASDDDTAPTTEAGSDEPEEVAGPEEPEEVAEQEEPDGSDALDEPDEPDEVAVEGIIGQSAESGAAVTPEKASGEGPDPAKPE